MRDRRWALATTDVLVVMEWGPRGAMGIEHHGAVRAAADSHEPQARPADRFCWDEGLRYPWWMGGSLGERLG